MENKINTLIIIIFSLFLIIGCQEEEEDENKPGTNTEYLQPNTKIESGDIIVSNLGSDSLMLLDSEGNFKKVVHDVVNNAELFGGITWNDDDDILYATIDGGDRVVKIDGETGKISHFISNTYLAGAIRDIAILNDGDFIIIESNNIERFYSDGQRVSNTDWPLLNIQTTPRSLNALSGGGFLTCSTGSDIVATYDNDGNLTASASSGIVDTTDSYGCIELSNGNIAVTWAGATDTVVVYNSDLSSTIASYSNISLLPNPRGITERHSNGNLLITDASYHHIVEITSAGEYVQTLGGAVLSYPMDILVVP